MSYQHFARMVACQQSLAAARHCGTRADAWDFRLSDSRIFRVFVLAHSLHSFGWSPWRKTPFKLAEKAFM
jgi:hypothetical protein